MILAIPEVDTKEELARAAAGYPPELGKGVWEHCSPAASQAGKGRQEKKRVLGLLQEKKHMEDVSNVQRAYAGTP
jgi:hypothetical protein